MTCPRCHHDLVHDSLTVEAGGATTTQRWVAGCVRCKWTPGDEIDKRRECRVFTDHYTRQGAS